MPGEPVAGQAAQAQAEHARGEVRGADSLGQHEEARVVDDEEQALPALQGVPADPAFAGRAAQRGGLPAEQRQPAVAEHGDMPQAAPAELAEAEVVVRAQQRVEARHLVGTHDAHTHRAQRNRFGGHLPELWHNRTCFVHPLFATPQLPKLHFPTRPTIENPWTQQQCRSNP